MVAASVCRIGVSASGLCVCLRLCIGSAKQPLVARVFGNKPAVWVDRVPKIVGSRVGIHSPTRTVVVCLALAHCLTAPSIAAPAAVCAVAVVCARAHLRVGILEALIAAFDADVCRRTARSQDGNTEERHATWLCPLDLPLRPASQRTTGTRLAVAALLATPSRVGLDDITSDDVATGVQRRTPNLHANRAAVRADVGDADVTLASVNGVGARSRCASKCAWPRARVALAPGQARRQSFVFAVRVWNALTVTARIKHALIPLAVLLAEIDRAVRPAFRQAARVAVLILSSTARVGLAVRGRWRQWIAVLILPAGTLVVAAVILIRDAHSTHAVFWARHAFAVDAGLARPARKADAVNTLLTLAARNARAVLALVAMGAWRAIRTAVLNADALRVDALKADAARLVRAAFARLLRRLAVGRAWADRTSLVR